jgi:hypothetical protein
MDFGGTAMFYEPSAQAQLDVASYTPDPQPTLPQSYRGHLCIDCQAPISPYSRGRCRLCGYVGLKRNVPEDFAVTLRKLGSQGAARHYRASLGTVTRWRREIGLRPQERARKPSMMGAVRPRAFSERPLIVFRDFTLVGQAAEFLRHIGPVFRCHASGAAHKQGSHWNRNGWVLSDEDLMSRARRLGWAEVGF